MAHTKVTVVNAMLFHIWHFTPSSGFTWKWMWLSPTYLWLWTHHTNTKVPKSCNIIWLFRHPPKSIIYILWQKRENVFCIQNSNFYIHITPPPPKPSFSSSFLKCSIIIEWENMRVLITSTPRLYNIPFNFLRISAFFL